MAIIILLLRIPRTQNHSFIQSNLLTSLNVTERDVYQPSDAEIITAQIS